MLLNKYQTGLSFIELLVTLVILSILASAALPYAEISFRRDKELDLRRSLREIRTAIDGFHTDWKAGRMPAGSSAVSRDGYPVTLQVLVEGVDLASANARRRYYLRRIPVNPFAGSSERGYDEEQWQLRSYRDKPDAEIWGGQDVYDVRVRTEKRAINESFYKDW